MEQEKQITMPIDYLHYSALTQLLRNPLIFKMKYILNVYDGKMSVSGMIGRAGHEALQVYYGGHPDIAVPKNRAEAIGIAREHGLQYLDNFQDTYIEYGKTGTREKMLKGYAQAMDFYFSEEPEYNEILMCEEKMTGELRTMPDGDLLPLPASGVPDLVVENKDATVDIIDTKFTAKFTNYETEDWIKIIQAQFLSHLLLAAKGIKADRVVFREIKRTKNKPCELEVCDEPHDKEKRHQQIRDWVVPVDHEPYRILFYNLYTDVVKYLKNDPIFLPNLSDPFDGEHAGLLYAQGLINADMSDVEVVHKVRDIAFKSKKFIASRLDRAENETLLPEEKVKVRLSEFGIPVEPVETKHGASVTQYRFKVSAGVRMSTIKKHKDDIASVLESKGEMRILTPIPGTSLLGIEVESADRSAIKLKKKDLTEGLELPIGTDVAGEGITADLRDMPHLLIGGASGSGKSVLLHTLLTAITKQMTPEELELVLIDPKRVELSAFARKKHLHGNKVITDHKDAVKALLRLTDEMERRYKVLEKAGKRDLKEFNESKRNPEKRLPYIVMVVDEFADLMLRSKVEERKKGGHGYQRRSKPWLEREIDRRQILLAPDVKYTKAMLSELLEEDDLKDETNREDANVELLTVRLAQLGRAAGIHMIVATQRPSVDVITGLIKANFPTRIALTTASPTDSQVILGKPGAEKLAGKGDLLLQHPEFRGEKRLQGYILK